MRKNLFLTLALLLATFAGATAQDWSVTLDGTVGLPGDTALNEKNEKLLHFQSGIIKTDAPIQTLRFSVAGTVSNEKPAGNNVTFALSELNVYNADMSEELTYKATSNADHNTLTQSFDGKGLIALNDGKTDNFFHSMWGGNGAVADYHYIELKFDEPIEEFVIEWYSRATNMKNAPTIVGLTAGKDFVPYTDRDSEFTGVKITNFETLANGAYFVIRGNAPAEYHTYNNSTGEQTSKEPVEGSGPMYTKPGGDGSAAVEPSLSHVAKLIPTDEDDTYYIYYPIENAYLSGDAVQNALNSALNGWQMTTKDINKAAKVGFKALSDGDFEMFYYTEIEVEDNAETADKDESWSYEGDVYVGADPRSGKMKIFSDVKKRALEANGWCEGFGLVCAFDWSFYEAEYNAPAWAKVYDLGLVYLNAKKLMNAIENYELLIELDLISTLEDIIADVDDALTDADLSDDDINTIVNQSKMDLSNFICDIAYEEDTYMNDQEAEYGWPYWLQNSTNEVVIGWWSLAAYEKYIQPGAALIEVLLSEETDYDYCYDDYFAAVVDYFANREANINAFLASEYKAESSALPFTFNVTNIKVQEQKVELSKAINGFRWTLTATQSGNKNGTGHLFTSFVELEVLDADNNKVALTADLITSNATQPGEGSIEGMVDGKADTYWHSIWSGDAHSPAGNAYLDIKFPSGVSLSNFTIKFTNRDGQLHNAQTEFVISEYGKAFDDDGTDYYKVAVGAKITDLSQLENGGLYLLQGNLNVNLTENKAKPRFYAGATPYTDSEKDAANANCVYMFKKVGDCWNILSLSTAKYFKGASLETLIQSQADNVKIADSKNLNDTWVIYTEIDSVLESDYTHEIDENNSIAFGKTTVKATAQVYMDWAGGLASRPCYSPLPGVSDPQFNEKLTDELKVSSSCGDYLHYNKTNGEGEWSIYNVTMENEYYAYMLGLAEAVETLNIVAGTNPGCVKADEEVAADFEEAKAAIDVAVENKDTENAKSVTNAMITAVEALGNLERVGFEPTSVYRIESGLESFLEKTGYTRSIYAGAKKLAWTVTPASFDGENYDFLFRISNDEDEMETNRVTVAESEVGKAYILQNVGNGSYIGKDWAYASRPAYVVIENLESDVYNIKNNSANGGGLWHANNHGSGSGYGSDLVTYGGGVNSPSAWRFIYVGEADDYELSVEDVVVKGDEVVSVSYFTTSGAAIAEPVKGINIVVKVYANGVVEATKVLVK